MKRPSYREAVYWLANNDDCEWLKDDEPIISVTGALICDLFEVPQEKLIKDIRRRLDS